MAKTKWENLMARLSGPKGIQVREECDELVNKLMSDISELISKDEDHKYWYLDYLEVKVWHECRKMALITH